MLNYIDFATDELQYLGEAYGKGMRYSAMVSQAQRVCECYMKQLITNRLCNNNEVMVSHNLRKLYDYCETIGINLSPIRSEIMALNNFYTHTRYPGKDSFLAKSADVDTAVDAVSKVVEYLRRLI